MHIFIRLRPYIARYRSELIVGLAYLLLANGVAPLIPLVIRHAIDSIRPGNAAATLGWCAVGLVVLEILRGLGTYGMRMRIIGASRKVERDLRRDSYARLQALPPSYYLVRNTGDIMSRVTNDLESVRMLLGPAILHGGNTVVMTLGALLGMLSISPVLAFWSMLPLVILLTAVKFLGQAIHERSREVQDQLGVISTRAQENFAGARVVRAFARETIEAGEFHVLGVDYLDKTMHLAKLTAVTTALLAVVTECGLLITLWVCGLGIMDGTHTVGDLMAFIAYQFMLVWPMMALAWVVNLWQRGGASLDRLFDVLDAIPEPSGGASPAAAAVGGIEFRDVSFAYPGHAPVLTGLSFQVPPGRTVGIVGRTGAGKTTLVSLLPRFFHVSSGAVLVDGVNVEAWPVEELRRRIGFIPQDAFLFSERIRENIGFAPRDAGGEWRLAEVENAARQARLDGDIQGFPERYEQWIGERGVTLSGGQKQRATISRAIILDAPILVFDDSLSSVDADTEREILTELRKVAAGKTCFLISHRIATVRGADFILVLDGGRIVDRGTHDELLARGGLYAELARRQEMEIE